MVFVSEMVLLSPAVWGGAGQDAGPLGFRDIKLAWGESDRTVSLATGPGLYLMSTFSTWHRRAQKGWLPSSLPRASQGSFHSAQIYARHFSLGFQGPSLGPLLPPCTPALTLESTGSLQANSSPFPFLSLCVWAWTPSSFSTPMPLLHGLSVCSAI